MYALNDWNLTVIREGLAALRLMDAIERDENWTHSQRNHFADMRQAIYKHIDRVLPQTVRPVTDSDLPF